MTTTNNTEMVAAFYATANWQACRKENQYADNMIQLRAVEMRYAVVSEHGTWHFGFPTEDKAITFARSMHHTAIVMEVEPYWYCEGWGRVAASSVYAYDANDHTEWKIERTRYGNITGCYWTYESAGMRPVRIVSRGN